ncbi:MAG: ribbon-helix-helix domain-containing protein [Pseudomonadota bacterium]
MTETSKEKPRLIKRRGRPVRKGNEERVSRVKIGVSIDDVLWRRLRALAIREGKLTGELLDEAIEEYLEKYEKGR